MRSSLAGADDDAKGASTAKDATARTKVLKRIEFPLVNNDGPFITFGIEFVFKLAVWSRAHGAADRDCHDTHRTDWARRFTVIVVEMPLLPPLRRPERIFLNSPEASHPKRDRRKNDRKRMQKWKMIEVMAAASETMPRVTRVRRSTRLY